MIEKKNLTIDSDGLEPHSKESLFERLHRFVFGDDIFISYSRADSTYALALANKLTTKKLSCFLDQWGTSPGEQLPKGLLTTIKRCSTMVLIGSANAASSANVGLELEEFLQTGRPVIPITFVADELVENTPDDFNPQDLTGTLEQAEWYPLIIGIAKTTEVFGALKSKTPSENVVLRIVNAVQFRSRSGRLRKTFFSTLGALLILLLLGGVAVYKASTNVVAATEKRIAAEANANAAVQDQLTAQGKLSVAQQELSNTNKSLAATTSQLTNANAALNDAKTKIERSKTLLDQTTANLTTSQAALATTKTELGSTKTDLASQVVLLKDARIKTDAARIISGVGQNPNILIPAELNLIWYLSTANEAIRYSFLEQVFESPVNAMQFSNRFDMLTQAAIGLSDETRDYAIEHFILPHLRESSSPMTTRLASVDMGVALSVKNHEWARLALPTIIEAIQKNEDQDRRNRLADELIFATDQLGPEDVSPFFQQVVADAERRHRVSTNGDYKIIEALAKKLRPDDVQKAFGQIATAIRAIPTNTDDPHACHFWATALTLIPGALSPEQRKGAFDKLILNSNINPLDKSYDETNELRQDALKKFVTKIGPEDLLECIEQIMTAFENSGYGFDSKNHANILTQLAVNVPPEMSGRVMNGLSRIILKHEYSYYLDALFPALQLVGKKTSSHEKNKAAAQILKVLKESLQSSSAPDPGHFSIRLQALCLLKPILSTEDGEILLTRIISITDKETAGSDYYYQSVSALFELVHLLDPEGSHRILMTTISETSNPYLTGVLASALGSLPGVFAPAEADLIYRKLVEAEEATSRYTGSRLSYLRDGIKAVAHKVPPAEAKDICSQLSDIISRDSPRDPRHEILAEALTSFPDPICATQAENALQIIATKPLKIGFMSDEYLLAEWSSSVRNISGELTKANSQDVLRTIVNSIRCHSIPHNPGLKTAVKIVVEKSNPAEVQGLIRQLVSDSAKDVEVTDPTFGIERMNPEKKLYIAAYIAQTIALLPCGSNRGEIEEIWKKLLEGNRTIDRLMENYNERYQNEVKQAVNQGILELASCVSSVDAPGDLAEMLDSLRSPASDNDHDIKALLVPILAKRVANEDAQKVFLELVKPIETTADTTKRTRLIEAVKNLSGSIDQQLLVETLKSPVCVGPLRDIIIDKLGKELRIDFKGDIWAVTAWARAAGIDLSNPQVNTSNPS